MKIRKKPNINLCGQRDMAVQKFRSNLRFISRSGLLKAVDDDDDENLEVYFMKKSLLWID